jgi:hypothetical protein
MCVAGATGDILKVPDIKLSYLADAVWEFTRRKCAEAGEHLTDQQVLEIEAQVMEYFGKQRVEAFWTRRESYREEEAENRIRV